MLEILAPAGNALSARAAIQAKANAIYLGYSAFSARAGAENFNGEELKAILDEAHFSGVKVYVAMNTVVKNGELQNFVETLLFVWGLGADAIILQDVLLGKYIHENYPEIVLHLSTQAGVCTLAGAKFAKKCGFSRVILARETPLGEIRKIAAYMETEVFVQGALCSCFSGQCYFSSFVGGNSGNRGRCKQPCRKRYALNRKGYEEPAYALSLSDLCVGQDIQKLADAGVLSFKIEGRMRRAEYVSAAVRYYRSLLLDDGNTNDTFTALKRAYNRGNYTKGLAFGQDKRFLSRAIQGHLGERVGTVKVVNGKYAVDSAYMPVNGDAFKILRDGKEVGGAFFAGNDRRGFFLSSKTRLKNGDAVFLTTDTRGNELLLQGDNRRKIRLSLRFAVGERAVARCDGVEVLSETVLQPANASPLTREEIEKNFQKTDGLPIDVQMESVELQGEVFLPKSQLNAFRRSFFQAVYAYFTHSKNAQYEKAELLLPRFLGENAKTAVLTDDFTDVNTDVAVFKPTDFSAPIPESFLNGSFEKFLYLPAYMKANDEERLFALATENRLGVYVENYGALFAALQRELPVFAGTGLNVTNAVSLSGLLALGVKYYALSKELDEKEQSELMSTKAFALSSGAIKLMDLCYCPFEKTCKSCDRRRRYELTDENGRKFPLFRYVSADGDCRFEVYNVSSLVGDGVKGCGRLLDLTGVPQKQRAIAAQDDVSAQKQIYGNYTSGHTKNSVL